MAEKNAIGDKIKEVPDEKKQQNRGDKIIEEALAAYGIDPKYVFAGRYYPETGEAVILTNGGSKVRFRSGDKPRPLSQIAVTGINPDAARRKVVAGKAKG